MDVPSFGDIDGEGNAVVSGRQVPPCEEHRGTCLRCKTEISVKPRKKFQGKERRQRKTISIKVPQDEQENGAGVFDELVSQLRERYGQADAPIYYVLVKAMYETLTIVNVAFPHDGDPED